MSSRRDFAYFLPRIALDYTDYTNSNIPHSSLKTRHPVKTDSHITHSTFVIPSPRIAIDCTDYTDSYIPHSSFNIRHSFTTDYTDSQYLIPNSQHLLHNLSQQIYLFKTVVQRYRGNAYHIRFPPVGNYPVVLQ